MSRPSSHSRLTVSNSSSPATDKSDGSASDDSHKNEGFLKSAWHKLTHQHKSREPSDKKDSGSNAENPNKSNDSPQNDESKKASGSGSG